MPDFRMDCPARMPSLTHDHCFLAKDHGRRHACYCGVWWSEDGTIKLRRQQMWTMHSQMSSQMMTAMMANMRARGVTPSRQGMALRDSVTHDMADLPKLQGDTLRSRMQAHMDRMHRLMGVQAQAMGMPMGPMGMGCSW